MPVEDTVVKKHWAVARKYPDAVALMSKGPDGKWNSLTFSQFAGLYECFGAGLLDFGVTRGEHVGIISDNRKEWMIANLGILGIGAADVPRGCDSMEKEIAFILSTTDCRLVFLENKHQLEKVFNIKPSMPLLETIVLFNEPDAEDFTNAKKISYANPQQEKYLWGNVELFKWKDSSGADQKGLVYKPENFDPAKKELIPLDKIVRHHLLLE